MDVLRFLESIRLPALDTLMQLITEGGGELVFMVLAITVFWCIDKRCGYYIFTVGFFGTIINQFLKLAFRIPRPWVLDPNFTIVESARAGATGYSFPSGHTQNAVGTFGGLARYTKKRWVRVVCIVLAVLIPFSRMYLGVHTPLDVGVSVLVALVLLFAFYPLFSSDERQSRAMWYVLAAVIVLAAAYLAFVLAYAFPADIDADNLAEGTKTAFTMAGAVLGLLAVYAADRYRLQFDTKAPLLGQILKLVLGLALLVAIKAGLKAPLHALFGGYFADLVRYFLMVLFAGCVWPLTFGFFARVGRKKNA
ncbi:MAG: phosphatase PAP2 family protein [Clostridiales bacterium]|nr:phosphatase PAP2 family protein [Clostridiales bacterium]